MPTATCARARSNAFRAGLALWRRIVVQILIVDRRVLDPRPVRLLHRLPQLSDVLIVRLVDRFGSLPEIMSASAAELESVEGIGAATARVVRDGLARLVEASIFERYE